MAGSHSLFFLACLCLARDLVFCSEYEETGKAITLTPSIRGKPAEILWKHNGNKVLEYDGSELLEYGPFRGRVVVDFETGQLTIRELKSQDSGQYQSDFIINGEIQTFSHTLAVLDVLAEPQVTCELDNSSKVKSLLCSVESQTPLSYEWSGPTITAQSGPELRVEEPEENRDSVFTCTVKNPANSKSTSFNLRDCPADGAGAAVIISAVIGVLLLLILIIVLVVVLYKRKQKSRQSDVRKMDPENGEGQNLLKNDARRPVPGSSEATLPCHNRLPAQKESIADKKWDQAKGFEISGQQSFSQSNPEDTGNGNEREREENEENNKRSVEAKENPCTKPETEKERKNSLQSQDEENEKTPILKQESANGENEQKPEDNQKPGETAKETCGRDTGEDQTLQRNDPPDLMTARDRPAVDQPLDGGARGSPVRSFLHSQPMQFRIGSSEATLPCHNRLPAQKESIADKKWDQAKELENSGQQSFSESNQEDTENGNERENEENNKTALKAKEIACSTPDETEKERQNSLQSQDEEKEKSPMLKQESANEEKSPEHQKETPEEQKAEDDIEDKQMPAEGTCGRNADCDRPAVDQPSNGEAPSSPAGSFLYSRREQFRFDSPANVKKETINVSSANPTDPTDNTDQNKEETTCPGLEQDEKDKVATNQEQKDVKEQMSEGKDPEPEMSEETDELTIKSSAAEAQ